jgi:aminomethyltransferase
MVTRDVRKIAVGRVGYAIWCDEDGMAIDDGTLFQLTENTYRLCSQHHQLDWLLMSAAGFDVQVEVETHDVAALAVQGPTSYSVLTAAGIDGLDDLKPFGIRRLECGGMPVTISRTGYTGEDGYEILLPDGEAGPFWNALLDAGVKPCGLGARDTLRLEAGMNLYGQDMDEDVTPLESGLAWTVAMKDDRQFIGRPALERRRLRGLRAESPPIDVPATATPVKQVDP